VGGSCYFCDSAQKLEKHHIIPQRFGGSDEEKNLVTVCRSCHEKLERLYNKEFYQKLEACHIDKADCGVFKCLSCGNEYIDRLKGSRLRCPVCGEPEHTNIEIYKIDRKIGDLY